MMKAASSGNILTNTVFYGFAAAAAKALALLTVPYLTRALSPAGYGLADLATSTAALLTVVATFSGDIPAARAHGLAQDAPERRRILASYVWATATTAIGLALLLLPASPVIADTLWAEESQGWLAALSISLVPISAVQAALAQTLRIRGLARAFTIVSLVDLLGQLGLAVAFVALGLGPAGVVAGFILGSVLGTLASAWAARDGLWSRPDGLLARSMIVQGLRFLPYATMFVIADWVLRAVVAHVSGSTGVADLAVAIRVASILHLLGGAFALAWGPIGLARQNDLETGRRFARILSTYGALALATALAIGAVGPELVAIAAGQGYDGAALILPGLAIAYAVAGAEYVLVVTAGISDRASRVAVSASVGASTQIAATILLVPALGAAAIGPVAVFGRVISFGSLWFSLRHAINLPAFRVIGVTAAAATIGALVQFALPEFEFGQAARWAVALGMAVVIVALSRQLLARSRAEAS